MRKKIWIAAAAAASLVILNGCLAETYPLTEEEKNIIAEYAAGVLLRNDAGYTQALVSPTPIPSPTPAPSPTPEPTTAAGNKGNGGLGGGDIAEVKENASLEDVYGLEGLLVTYDDFEVVNQIEETNGYVVPYEQGKKVVKLNFTLKNTAGIEQVFDFSKQSINYQLDCKERNFIPPMITALAGDMLYMETTLAPGESCGGFVLFRIPEKAEDNITNVIISRDTYTSIIALKK
ncbi:MAG: hypothetical protein K2N63_02490 [Lachnospiraceae bacterium]|nr:hypothetical protein [Lachnospiraceae bacterium]